MHSQPKNQRCSTRPQPHRLAALLLSPLLFLTAFTSARAEADSTSEPALHWAYQPPQTPPLPRVGNESWCRTALDHFILRQLEHHHLQPSPEAPPEILLRRLYLDLIGIPPSPEEVERFVADPSPVRYHDFVERLLSSPAYGERWAVPWLDLARYADSNGFQRDGFRDLWAYRDYVIRSFNQDKPFTQFTVEQLAGDLIPDAGWEQKVATGFHRCTTVNVEAGTDQEENRVNQVIDRVNVTATLWLGTSMECAQCHDHKHDPVSQREYYQFYAFFNNTPVETEFRTPTDTAAIDFTGPYMNLPKDPWRDERTALQHQLQAERDALKSAKAFPNTKKTVAQLEKKIAKLTTRLNQLPAAQSLVMAELDEPRPTHIFKRGDFLQPGEPVAPATPAFLHPYNSDRLDRLGLAHWIINRQNPLTARVIVNRWWAQFFGTGLVPTLEDFGTQAAQPTHPELLDWLATAFMDSGWSMKFIHRQIVLSATYRQNSSRTPDRVRLDPRNTLYSWFPRTRLPAELIRDNALAIAGLLHQEQGGPPVRPYQPAGIWRVTGKVDNTYRQSSGGDSYRRGVYVVWRRSAPYPSFTNFDAPNRTACTVQRSRSNTPLQALTLLNDPVYVEAAQALLARVLTGAPQQSAPFHLQRMFQLCTARTPQPDEANRLEVLFDQVLRTRDPQARTAFAKQAQSLGIDLHRYAAYYAVATALLNLDETITKG